VDAPVVQIHEVTSETVATTETIPSEDKPKTNWIQQPPWGKR
jgi:hypothetical protein